MTSPPRPPQVGCLGRLGHTFLLFLPGDGSLECVRPIPKAPERSWHASGPSFRPNGRLWTQFGPFSMIWARTDIVDPTRTSRRPGTAPWSGLDPSQRLQNSLDMLPSFRPNDRFWTHFGPFLMFLARLENQVSAKLGPEPPTRPAGSGTFFWAPFRNFFLPLLPGMPSLGLSLHIFKHFLEMPTIT